MMGDESYHDLINNVPKDFFKNVIYYIVGDISDNVSFYNITLCVV